MTYLVNGNILDFTLYLRLKFCCIKEARQESYGENINYYSSAEAGSKEHKSFTSQTSTASISKQSGSKNHFAKVGKRVQHVAL